MTESITPPTIRVRISHDKTSKGWRCNETTVEMSGVEDRAGADALIAATMKLLLHDAHENGLDEARRRNILEGFPV